MVFPEFQLVFEAGANNNRSYCKVNINLEKPVYTEVVPDPLFSSAQNIRD